MENDFHYFYQKSFILPGGGESGDRGAAEKNMFMYELLL